MKCEVHYVILSCKILLWSNAFTCSMKGMKPGSRKFIIFIVNVNQVHQRWRMTREHYPYPSSPPPFLFMLPSSQISLHDYDCIFYPLYLEINQNLIYKNYVSWPHSLHAYYSNLSDTSRFFVKGLVNK